MQYHRLQFWIKCGIVAALINTVFSLLFYDCLSRWGQEAMICGFILEFSPNFLGLIVYEALVNHDIKLPFMILHIFSFLIWFIIGSICGFIYLKIKAPASRGGQLT